MYYAGIDWADNHHDVVVIDETGQRKGSRRVAHTPQGLADLNIFLLGITTEVEQMACIIETNQGLLITALLEMGWPVYPVNPKTVDRKRRVAGAKTDLIDAYLLAKTGRSDLPELRRLHPDSPAIAELKELTRDQDSLVGMQTRLVNQLTACLKAYYPVALELFSKLHQRSTLVFLQTYPTPQTAQAASIEELTAVLKEAGHTRAEQVASRLYQSLHSPQLLAGPVITRTKSRLMLSIVAQLLPVVEAIGEYDKEITALFLSHADYPVFSSLPRAGKRLAPRLLAEIGEERARYAAATNLQAVAGTSPVPFESGNYSRAHRRYACIKSLRNALYQFAWQSTQQEEWAAAYYRRKRAEGKSHSVAVRALANNWLRIIFAIWQSQKPYCSAIFIAAQHQHTLKAA